MDAVVGALFLATSGVVFAWACVKFRRPNPPRWTQREFPALTVTLAVLTFLSSGVAFLGRFVADFSEQSFGLAEAALILVCAAVIVGSIILSRERLSRLRAAARSQAEAGSAVTQLGAPSHVEGPEPATPSPPRTPARGKRPARRKVA